MRRRTRGRPVVESSQAACSAFQRAPRSLSVGVFPRTDTTHRRRVALAMLQDKRAELFELGHEAAVMYACSILICNEVGWFRLEDVEAAMDDPALRSLAERLVHEANHVR